MKTCTPSLDQGRLRLSSLGVVAVVALLCLAASSDRAAGMIRKPGSPSNESLTGQLLVASRNLLDPNFSQTVIYVLAHNDTGALGVVINRRVGSGQLRHLLPAFGIKTTSRHRIDVHVGGPVDLQRGMVLHSPDYRGSSTRILSDRVALTASAEVLTAAANGAAPKQLMLIMGCAGWGKGQLEQEIARRDWMVAPEDVQLIFSQDPKNVWAEALKRVRVKL
jgi:putative transcriptional regulator